jgi:hypothetical protein
MNVSEYTVEISLLDSEAWQRICPYLGKSTCERVCLLGSRVGFQALTLPVLLCSTLLKVIISQSLENVAGKCFHPSHCPRLGSFFSASLQETLRGMPMNSSHVDPRRKPLSIHMMCGETRDSST